MLNSGKYSCWLSSSPHMVLILFRFQPSNPLTASEVRDNPKLQITNRATGVSTGTGSDSTQQLQTWMFDDPPES